jgi:pyruvate kinase
MKKNTKIVCTLGPASDDVTVLERMMCAGMNVVRLNFSHGTHDHMKALIRNIRKASDHCKKPVALLQDLQGPKIRVGDLPGEGIEIKKGSTIILSTRDKTFKKGPPSIFPVQYKHLHKDVKKNDLILLDDGYMELKVERVKSEHIFCTVRVGGTLKSHKGINCPTATISAQTITSKDKKDLAFGLKQNIDYVALSFVKSAQDILDLRALLKKAGKSHVKIIAKIERHEAVENLESIAAATDALMVARGDLGIEIPAEQVPIVQKEILHWGLLYGKPVIIATQVLESMIHNPRATRAEVSDAATAVFEHADAIMLSAETSVGKYPVKAVRTLAKVAHATEKEIKKKEFLLHNHLFKEDMPITDATCYNAAVLAQQIEANVIVVLTKTGYTAQQIMKHRTNTPVIAITHDPRVARQLQLVWGLNIILLTKKTLGTESDAPKKVQQLLTKNQLCKSGHELVIVNAGKRNNFISTVVL